MTFAKRLRFFGLGIVLGTLLSLMLFGPERFSCSGYLPESRVLAELQTKKWEYDSAVFLKLKPFGIDSSNLKKTLLKNATIDFDKSEPRRKPCGKYVMYYPEDSAKISLQVLKCDSTAKIEKVDELKE